MTTKKKPKVYITRKLPDAVETRMRELFDAELNIDDTPRTTAGTSCRRAICRRPFQPDDRIDAA